MVNIIGLKKACEILCTAAVVISLHAALFIADTIICRLNRISNVFHSAHSWAVISASSVSASTMSWDVEAPRGGFVGTFTMSQNVGSVWHQDTEKSTQVKSEENKHT